MAVIINGKEVANKIHESIKNEIANLAEKPSIAVIIVGSNPASKVYVAKKKKTAEAIGMTSSVIEMPENVSQEELEHKIDELNADKNINAILVQLPLPKTLCTDKIIQKILPEKDVDGFHPLNAGKMLIDLEPYALPCTPSGVMRLLEEYNIPIEGKNAVIVGRSNIVGKPLSYLLLKKNATVTICHSKTNNLKEITGKADILIAAIGRHNFITADHVKEGAVVIDVGINRNPEGKLAGDVDFDNVQQKAGYITPVPGGVGPMTIAMLLQNTLDLYKLQTGAK